MSIGKFIQDRARLFAGPLQERDPGRPATPPEGRWSDDIRDLPPAENGIEFQDTVRVVIAPGMDPALVAKLQQCSDAVMVVRIDTTMTASNYPLPDFGSVYHHIEKMPARPQGVPERFMRDWRNVKPGRR